MEDSPAFNAGRGSVLNSDGCVEMDASIMSGQTLDAGALAGIRTAKNPITVARKVFETTPHVMLVGSEADRFVRESGLDTAPQEYFITPHRIEQLQRDRGALALDHGTSHLAASAGAPAAVAGAPAECEPSGMGTVGAVALDGDGHLAAATSTGGLSGKRPGRAGACCRICSLLFALPFLSSFSLLSFCFVLIPPLITTSCVRR